MPLTVLEGRVLPLPLTVAEGEELLLAVPEGEAGSRS